MKRSRYLKRIGVLVTVLMALALTPGVAALESGFVDGSIVSSPFGTFGGIPYLKYVGRFVGTTAADYSVPFEIYAPADPGQGNGILIMEPFHVMGGAAALWADLTPEFLFSQGFSYAGIGWHPDDVDPFVWYSVEEAIQILGSLAHAVRDDPIAQGMVGDVQRLYGVGVSKTCEPLHSFLHSPGADVLDLTLLLVPSWADETHVQPAGANPVMVFLTENDLVDSKRASLHTEALRGSSSTYRSYEVAGAPHIADVPWVRAISLAMFGITSEGTTPLDWTPVARALLMAGHRWVTEGTKPPPSTFLAPGPEGELDPVYQSRYGLELETGIARDANGNALGGIRLPDLEIGRGQYIALDPASFFEMGLFGAFEDLKCVPPSDGSARFRNHGSYVSQFVGQTQRLVKDGFLLQGDAQRLIEGAATSDVGKPHACPP